MNEREHLPELLNFNPKKILSDNEQNEPQPTPHERALREFLTWCNRNADQGTEHILRHHLEHATQAQIESVRHAMQTATPTNRAAWLIATLKGAREDGQQITGWRWVKGTHSGTYVPDTNGTDRLPPDYDFTTKWRIPT